jgi:hypothetical protein
MLTVLLYRFRGWAIKGFGWRFNVIADLLNYNWHTPYDSSRRSTVANWIH